MEKIWYLPRSALRPSWTSARRWKHRLASSAGRHLMVFVSLGLALSFGVFQPYYEETLGMVPSAVSWIGTMQIFLLLGVGILSGRATDAGLVHETVFVGTFLAVIGLFTASLSTQFYQLFLSQGICIGLGMGMLYIPGVSVPASYFESKKAIVLAIANSGTGTGGLVYPVMVDKYGHVFTGFNIIDSINLLLASNGLGILGRLSTAFIASRWCGPLNTSITSVILAAIILYCWISVGDSRSGLYVFAAIYGFLSNGIQSLIVVSLAALTDDHSMLGTRMGMAFSVVAFASLTGGPVGGALIQTDGGSYLGEQIWGGTVMLLGAVAWTAARVWRTGFVLQTKI
ncbi:hypothetical protein MMC29_000216 [Sticta canariensis]|nr:hypothetical protein [Sticta canariensis]